MNWWGLSEVWEVHCHHVLLAGRKTGGTGPIIITNILKTPCNRFVASTYTVQSLALSLQLKTPLRINKFLWLNVKVNGAEHVSVCGNRDINCGSDQISWTHCHKYDFPNAVEWDTSHILWIDLWLQVWTRSMKAANVTELIMAQIIPVWLDNVYRERQSHFFRPLGFWTSVWLDADDGQWGWREGHRQREEK